MFVDFSPLQRKSKKRGDGVLNFPRQNFNCMYEGKREPMPKRRNIEVTAWQTGYTDIVCIFMRSYRFSCARSLFLSLSLCLWGSFNFISMQNFNIHPLGLKFIWTLIEKNAIKLYLKISLA